MSFARKLSLTAAVLACGTRKELCARFRSVNPATEFELERSFKWLQGRAQPRSLQVYEDWARLVGSARSGAWFAGCSTEAFLTELCMLYSADAADLELRAQAFAGDAWLGSDRTEETGDHLCGTYVAYSWAWSPSQRDRLVRGLFTIEEGKRHKLVARYAEALPDGLLSCEGEAFRDGSVLHTSVVASGRQQHERLFFSLLAPGRPARVLIGQMQGVIISGPEPRPSSGRVLMLRIPQTESLPGACYLRAARGDLAQDLAGFDLPPIRPETLAATVLGFLNRDSLYPVDQVTFAELTALTIMLDSAREPPG
ncbi:hypothetical protein [Frigidibacter sp. MR17.24]|uniref:hypothetical protein n=1 Tax=Frigidibacter sp. MR17.24 TaxID=3127345 RepID=UPI0030131BD7